MRLRIFFGISVAALSFGCSSSETTTDSDVHPGTGLGGSGGQADASASDGASGAAGVGGTGGTGAGGTAGTGGTAGAGGAAGTGGTGAAGSAGAGGAGGGVGEPCSTDADCNSGSTCQVLPNATQTALELRCAPVVGANATGVLCSTNDDCRSGQCIQGHCSAPCSSSGDCTQAGSCRTEPITVGALSGTFDMCVVEPCGSTAECDPGEYCSELHEELGILTAYCRQGNAGGDPIGDACATGASCASLNCPTWVGFCTEICSGDSDCVAASEQACVDVFNNGSSSLSACAPACERQSDCPTDSTCAIATDSSNDLHRFTCGPGWGSDPVGSDCTTTNDCASGLCLQNSLNGEIVDSICTAPCVTGADCPSGYQVCADLTMMTPSQSGSQTIRACNHP